MSALFCGPLGVLKGEGLGTKEKGEGPAGGAGKEGRLPAGKGPTCGPDRLGLSPVLSYPAFSATRLATGVVRVVGHSSHVDTVFVLGRVG